MSNRRYLIIIAALVSALFIAGCTTQTQTASSDGISKTTVEGYTISYTVADNRVTIVDITKPSSSPSINLGDLQDQANAVLAYRRETPEQAIKAAAKSMSIGKITYQPTTKAVITQAPSDPHARGAWIFISYSGSWQGALLVDNTMKSINGNGQTWIDIDDDASIVSVNAQKHDGTSNRLRVNVWNDGVQVATEYTESPYGVAQVATRL